MSHSVAPPDMLALVKCWLNEHHHFGNLYVRVTNRNDVLLIFLGEGRADNYIASFNSDGHFWRWDKGCNKKIVDENLNPADPIFFERLEAVIRKALVMRVL